MAAVRQLAASERSAPAFSAKGCTGGLSVDEIGMTPLIRSASAMDRRPRLRVGTVSMSSRAQPGGRAQAFCGASGLWLAAIRRAPGPESAISSAIWPSDMPAANSRAA